MSAWGGYRSWAENEVTRGPELLSPVRFLWRSYQEHCRTWGFDQASAAEFVHWLNGEEGVRLLVGGSGRVRRVAVGLSPLRVPQGRSHEQDEYRRTATWRVG